MKLFSRPSSREIQPEDESAGQHTVLPAGTPLDRLKRGHARLAAAAPDDEMRRAFLAASEDLDPEDAGFGPQLGRRLARREAEAECRLRRLEGKAEALRALCLTPDELTETESARVRLHSVLDDLAARNAELGTRRARAEAQQRATNAAARLEEEYATRHKAYAARRADALRVAQYDAALPALPLWKEVTLRQNELAEITDKELAVEAEIADSRARLGEAEHRFSETEKKLAEALERQAASHEKIQRGRELLAERARLEKECEKQAVFGEHAESSVREAESAFGERRDELSQAEEKLQALDRHEDALSVHRLMFDKFDLVKDKLGSLRTETRLNEEYHEQQAELQKRLESLRLSAASAQSEHARKKNQLVTLQNELAAHRQNLQGLDIRSIDRRATALAVRAATLRRAASLWQCIASGHERNEELEAELQRRSVEAGYRTREIERLENQAAGLRDVWRRQNTVVALSMGRDVEQLRAELREGSQCPVCGATHHPYHSESASRHAELAARLSDELAETRARLQTLEDEILARKETQAAENARIDSLRHSIASLKARLESDSKEWDSLFDVPEEEHTSYGIDQQFAALCDCSASVNRHMRRTMIEMLVESTDALLRQANAELEACHTHQSHINRLCEQIERLSDETAEEYARLNEQQTEIRIATSTLELLQGRLDTNGRTVSGLYTDLDEMITLSGWFVMWKNNPDALRVHLATLFSDWQKTRNERSTARHAVEALEKDLKNHERLIDERRARAEKSIQSLKALQDAAEACDEKYARLFAGDETPDSLEERLAGAIAETREALETRRRELTIASTAMTELRQSLAGLVERRQKAAARIADLEARLELRLQSAEISPQPAELEHLFTQERDWAGLRAELENLRTQLEASRLALDKARAEQHRLQAEKPEDTAALDLKETALAQRREQALADLEQVTSRLAAHRESRRRLDALEADLSEARAAYSLQEKIRKAWDAGK